MLAEVQSPPALSRVNFQKWFRFFNEAYGSACPQVYPTFGLLFAFYPNNTLGNQLWADIIGNTTTDEDGNIVVEARPVLEIIPTPAGGASNATVTMWKIAVENRNAVLADLKVLKSALVNSLPTADQERLGNTITGLLNVTPSTIAEYARTHYGTPDAADFSAGIETLQTRMLPTEEFSEIVARHLAVHNNYATNNQPIAPFLQVKYLRDATAGVEHIRTRVGKTLLFAFCFSAF